MNTRTKMRVVRTRESSVVVALSVLAAITLSMLGFMAFRIHRRLQQAEPSGAPAGPVPGQQVAAMGGVPGLLPPAAGESAQRLSSMAAALGGAYGGSRSPGACSEIRLRLSPHAYQAGRITLRLTHADAVHRRFSLVCQAGDRETATDDRAVGETVSFAVPWSTETAAVVIDRLSGEDAEGQLCVPNDLPHN